jgi:DNA replication protein DnaC
MAKKNCPACEGTGWRMVETAGVLRATRCDCNLEARPTDLVRRAQIPPRYELASFENFFIRPADAVQLQHALSSARKYVEDWPQDFGLAFIGDPGAGKTHLAVATIRALMLDKAEDCLFVDFRDLLQKVRDTYNQETAVTTSSELGILDPIVNTKVVLIDELVATKPSDWVREKVAYIFNTRYNNKRVTLLTSTLRWGAGVKEPNGERITLQGSLDEFGEMFSSRLYEMCKPIEIHAGDFRKAINQAGYRFHAD